MKIIKPLISIILIFSIFALSSCSDVFGGESSELIIGVENIGSEFNPLYVESDTDKTISSQIFGYVQTPSTDNSLINSCGGISYEYIGETQVKYTVTLRDDLFFSDGKNVTIDDVIFFYHFIADATYQGVYSDWYLNDIVGLKEYYFDDPDYINSLNVIDSEVGSKYSSATISKSDYINYLIGTRLEGKFTGGLDSLSPSGKSWREYFSSIEYTQELEKLGASPSDMELLTVAARAEAENNPLSYNPSDYYKEKLISEYIGSNYSDGADVSSISGIKKINDYSCTILFNSRNLNAVSEINAPIISKAGYEAEYIKGAAASLKEKGISAVGSGPYCISEVAVGSVILKENAFYHKEIPDFTTLNFVDLAHAGKDPVDAIKKGEVDIISVDASDEVLKELDSDKIKTVISNRKSYISVFFNTRSLGLSERKALSGLCNFNNLISSRIGRYYTAVYMPLSIRFPEYPSDIISPVYSENTFEAYSLMNPAGIKAVSAYLCAEKESLEYLILEEYKKILSEKDIALTIKLVDSDQLNAAIESGEADMWIESVADMPTCDKFDYYNIAGSLNKTGLNDDRINNLTNLLRSSIGFSNRKDMTRQLLSAVMVQAVECPVCQLQTVTAYNSEKISSSSFGENFNYDGFTYVLPLLRKK